MTTSDANAGPDTVIVMAHGSRHEPANLAHLALCRDLAVELTDTRVRAAFLELSDPRLPDALATAVDDGAERILVLPYFLHPGNHTTRDIPQLVAEARSAHPGLTIDVGAHFGSDPAMVGLLTGQIRSASDVDEHAAPDPIAHGAESPPAPGS